MAITQAEILAKLWSLANKEATKANTAPEYAFDPVGLILIHPMKTMGYDLTPINSLAFAETGGDGVHFSLLQLNGEVSANSPVIMTVPMQPDRPNIVVGHSLFEFLCLGKEIGYFPLEQLAYDQRATIEWISSPEKYFEQEYSDVASDSYFIELLNRKKHLLNLLTAEFDLKPWNRIEQRLNELQSQYLSLLQLQML